MDTKRYFYLDNLKWALVVLVIIDHSACTAGLLPMGYNLPHVIKSAQWQYNILRNICLINYSFFMSLFFFVSAYFVSSSLARKGAGRFVLGKLKRLGIPTLMTLFITFPVLSIAIYYFMPHNFVMLGIKNLNYLSTLNYFIAPLFKTGNITLGVTWFTWTLIVFNIFFVLGNKLFSLRASKPKIEDKKIPAIWKMFVFAIIMIPINYFGLYLQNHLGNSFLGFYFLRNFPMYIAMFYFGIQAFKYNWLDQLKQKHAFYGILMWILGQVYLTPIAQGYNASFYVLSRGFTVIGMSMFLIYGFKTLFDTKNKWTAILSRSAFATYFVQQIPQAFIAGIYSRHMTQIPIINFIVIAIPSIICAFFVGFVMCKLPVLRRIF